MITLNTDRNAIGDVHCLNCGRALAQVVRNPANDSYQLLPTVNQSTVQVIVAGRRLLRCRRCGGRAFVELREETPLEEFGPAIGATLAEEPEPAYTKPVVHGSHGLGWRVSPRERDRAHSPVRSVR